MLRTYCSLDWKDNYFLNNFEDILKIKALFINILKK